MATPFALGDNPKSWGMKRVLEEISKCEVVCANCHKVRTWKRLRGLGEQVCSS